MDGGESHLEKLAARVSDAFYVTMLLLGTGDVLTVGTCCKALSEVVECGEASDVSSTCHPSAGLIIEKISEATCFGIFVEGS